MMRVCCVDRLACRRRSTFIGELEDDGFSMDRHRFEHLCIQLQGKVNLCPFHVKETRTWEK